MGIEGLWNRLEQLSWDYQKQRSDLESNDLTSLAIRAICHSISKKSGINSGISGVSGVSGVKSAIGKEIFLLTAELTNSAHVVIDEHELDFDKDRVTSRRFGHVLRKMRLEKHKQAGTGKRGWRLTWDDLERWVDTYGIDLMVALGLKDDEEQTSANQATNATNAANATNATANDDLLRGTI